ncbi:hypothetical protein Tco_1136293 [Tanacetum coccineum]
MHECSYKKCMNGKLTLFKGTEEGVPLTVELEMFRRWDLAIAIQIQWENVKSYDGPLILPSYEKSKGLGIRSSWNLTLNWR